MSETLLLAIDCCGATGGVALARVRASGLELIGQRPIGGRTYSALLVAEIREILNEARVVLEQVDAIVVVHGPGSFTGVRIGVSAAKGLAEALAIPVIAVSRLEMLALKAAGACVVLDAGRGEFYARLDGRESLLDRDEVMRIHEAGTKIAGCEVLPLLSEMNVEVVDAPTARDALQLGAERWRVGAFDDVVVLDGNYVRRSDAELFAKSQPVASPLSE